jgi:hypothetical protein
MNVFTLCVLKYWPKKNSYHTFRFNYLNLKKKKISLSDTEATCEQPLLNHKQSKYEE